MHGHKELFWYRKAQKLLCSLSLSLSLHLTKAKLRVHHLSVIIVIFDPRGREGVYWSSTALPQQKGHEGEDGAGRDEVWSQHGESLTPASEVENFNIFLHTKDFIFLKFIPELKVMMKTVCYQKHRVTGKAGKRCRNTAGRKWGGLFGWWLGGDLRWLGQHEHISLQAGGWEASFWGSCMSWARPSKVDVSVIWDSRRAEPICVWDCDRIIES